MKNKLAISLVTQTLFKAIFYTIRWKIAFVCKKLQLVRM